MLGKLYDHWRRVRDSTKRSSFVSYCCVEIIVEKQQNGNRLELTLLRFNQSHAANHEPRLILSGLRKDANSSVNDKLHSYTVYSVRSEIRACVVLIPVSFQSYTCCRRVASCLTWCLYRSTFCEPSRAISTAENLQSFSARFKVLLLVVGLKTGTRLLCPKSSAAHVGTQLFQSCALRLFLLSCKRNKKST